MAKANKETNIGGTVSLTNVKLNYVHLADMDEGKFGVHCSDISEDQKAELETIGIKPRHGNDRVNKQGEKQPTPEWGFYINPKTQFEFAIVDGTGVELKGETRAALVSRIGAGSTANVEVKSGAYNKNGNSGVSAYLQGVQIANEENIVEATGKHGFKPVDGGFAAAPTEDNVPY